jgi:hypothetical protein
LHSGSEVLHSRLSYSKIISLENLGHFVIFYFDKAVRFSVSHSVFYCFYLLEGKWLRRGLYNYRFVTLLEIVQELWVHTLGSGFKLLKGLLVLVYDP